MEPSISAALAGGAPVSGAAATGALSDAPASPDASLDNGSVMCSYAWEKDGTQPPDLSALIAALEESRIKVWYDKVQLKDGDRYDKKIRDAILSCNVMVVYVTPRYHASVKEGRGCLPEVKLALSRTKEDYDVLVVGADKGVAPEDRAELVEELKKQRLYVSDAAQMVPSVVQKVRDYLRKPWVLNRTMSVGGTPPKGMAGSLSTDIETMNYWPELERKVLPPFCEVHQLTLFFSNAKGTQKETAVEERPDGWAAEHGELYGFCFTWRARSLDGSATRSLQGKMHMCNSVGVITPFHAVQQRDIKLAPGEFITSVRVDTGHSRWAWAVKSLAVMTNKGKTYRVGPITASAMRLPASDDAAEDTTRRVFAMECKKGGAIDELNVLYCERGEGAGAGAAAPCGGGGGGGAAGPLPNGCYIISSRKAKSYVMDAKGGSRAVGTPLILWPRHGGENQKFFARALQVPGLFSLAPAWCADGAVALGLNAAGRMVLCKEPFQWRIEWVAEEGGGWALRPAEGDKRVGAPYALHPMHAEFMLEEPRPSRGQLFIFDAV